MPQKPAPENRAALGPDGSYRPRTRLHVAAGLAAGARVLLTPPQAHYLANVLRLAAGDAVCLFNGRDGEWRARLGPIKRGAGDAVAETMLRPQAAEPDLWLLFAPLKKARTDYLAEKATELGVARLWPVFTRRTNAERVNLDRLRATAVEAAEQSERLTVPELREPAALAEALADWPAGRRLLVCDETGGGEPVATALAREEARGPAWAVLIGPEGGFARDELDGLRKLPFVTPVGLGPRILRADTAALAALACLQALAGDWRRPPRA